MWMVKFKKGETCFVLSFDNIEDMVQASGRAKRIGYEVKTLPKRNQTGGKEH